MKITNNIENCEIIKKNKNETGVYCYWASPIRQHSPQRSFPPMTADRPGPLVRERKAGERQAARSGEL
jgi:hypothetical protein